MSGRGNAVRREGPGRGPSGDGVVGVHSGNSSRRALSAASPRRTLSGFSPEARGPPHAAHRVHQHRDVRAGPGRQERRVHPVDGHVGRVDPDPHGDHRTALGGRGAERRGHGPRGHVAGAGAGRPEGRRPRLHHLLHAVARPLLPGHGRVPAAPAGHQRRAVPRRAQPVHRLPVRPVDRGRLDSLGAVPARPPGGLGGALDGDGPHHPRPGPGGAVRRRRRRGDPGSHRGRRARGALDAHLRRWALRRDAVLRRPGVRAESAALAGGPRHGQASSRTWRARRSSSTPPPGCPKA